MVYEIWDLDSGNRIGEFDSQARALAEVKHALDRHGEAYVATLLLDAEDDQGHTRLIAEGGDLVALVRGSPTVQDPDGESRLIRSAANGKRKARAKVKPAVR